MFWVELAIYIVIITSLIYFSQFFLWIVFGLFSYRFWTVVLPYETFSKIIPFDKMSHYTIAILILAAITYFGVMLCTQSIPFLKYVFLLVMALYTLREHSISDVMFFKDYLEGKGMWNIQYWIDAVKNIFTISENPDGVLGIFKAIGEKILGTINAFANYIKGL